MNDIVPPEISEGTVVELSVAQLRQIYDRVELIDRHFEKCCAFQMDSCRYGDEYNQLYGYLHLAGLDPAVTPFDRGEFEQWISERKGAAS